MSVVFSGGECVWWGRRRRPPGRVDSSVRRLGVEARGGRPLPSPGHRCTAVGDWGAVWTANPGSEGGSCHDECQPAQPLEGDGGNLLEAQRKPDGKPGLQSRTHRVLTLTFLCFCVVLISLPVYLRLSLCLCLPNPSPTPTSLVSFFLP